jgi:hypothetical protein
MAFAFSACSTVEPSAPARIMLGKFDRPPPPDDRIHRRDPNAPEAFFRVFFDQTDQAYVVRLEFEAQHGWEEPILESHVDLIARDGSALPFLAHEDGLRWKCPPCGADEFLFVRSARRSELAEVVLTLRGETRRFPIPSSPTLSH